MPRPLMIMWNGLMRRLLPWIIVLCAGPAAMADEGMWTFGQFPLRMLQERHAVALDQPWLDRIRQATVRLEGGCTGSLVSPQGLLLTNQHCIMACIGQLAASRPGIAAEGFLAGSRSAEERCAAEQVSVLVGTEDITAEVHEAAGHGDHGSADDDAAASERRKALLTRLEQACEARHAQAAGRQVCEAVKLHGGGQYFLYRYRRYDDVRLVFAPEHAVAFFGGDIDNFEFPRWNLDFALLRIYTGGRPAATPGHLHWRAAGAAAGEVVFVAGHPGRTRRQSTMAELLFERDPVLTHWLPRAAELRGRYRQFAVRGEQSAREVEEPLFMLENAFKVRRRHLDVLLDEALLARHAAGEQQLHKALKAGPESQSCGSAFEDIAQALEAWRGFYDRHQFLDAGAALQGDLGSAARLLVRSALEREKPAGERHRDFTDGALVLLHQQLLAPAPVYPDLEVLRLTFSLEKLVEFLGVDDPVVKTALAGTTPHDLAARLVGETKLADAGFRARLWDGGRSALEAAGDPLIALALRLEPAAVEVRRRFELEVEPVLERAQACLARARFAAGGAAVYPDASFTLRLGFGTVRGWREGDRDVTPFTTIAGLYARATGAPPFALPPRWLAARGRIAGDTVLNFVTDHDITGGNSGSPVLDVRGRLVGLMFDGNTHSIGGQFWFDAARNRAVAVHPAAMLLALGEIYGAAALLQEMSIE